MKEILQSSWSSARDRRLCRGDPRGQLGLDMHDRGSASRLGGTCLNVGCIPSKALIHAADEFEAVATRRRRRRSASPPPPPTLDLAQTVAWKDGSSAG